MEKKCTLNYKIIFLLPPLNERGSQGLLPRGIPYQTLLIATYLKNTGYDPVIWDCFLLDISFHKIVDKIEREDDINLLAIPLSQDNREFPIEVSIKLATLLKTKFPLKTIILYNRFPVIEKIKGIPKLQFDYVLTGDVELSFIDLLNAIVKKNKRIIDIGGLAYFEKSVLKQTSLELQLENVDLLFFPQFSLLDMERYIEMPHRYKGRNFYYMESARGCSWGLCKYCQENFTKENRKYSFRSRSPENVVEEIKHAIKIYAADEIQFNNPQFQTDIGWLQKFEMLLKEQNIKISWSALSRADCLNSSVVGIFKRTGCHNLLVGIESFKKDHLNFLDKNITEEDIVRAIENCSKFGIEVTGSFLLGLPDENILDVIKNMSKAAKLGIDYVQIFIAKWWNEDATKDLEGKGELKTDWDVSEYDFFGPIFVPKSYRHVRILKIAKKVAYLYFYLHPLTLWRIFKKIHDLNSFTRILFGGIVLLKVATINIGRKR
ncbi:MAG: radical SAM protein [Oligoflexia bacterium]|nr:radical SAM protein [Oligoflexia bacterium]